LPTVPSTASEVGREDARTFGELATDLLRRLGQDVNDLQNRSLAQSSLRQAVQSFNMLKSWVDRRLVANVALVAGTETYELPSRFRRLVGRAYLLDSAGKRLFPVEDIPYEEYLMRVRVENVADSFPIVFFIQNRVNDSLLTVWPAPNAASVTAYPTLMLAYFADIPSPNDESDHLGVSEALEAAIFSEALYVLNDMIGSSEKARSLLAQAMAHKQMAVGYDNEFRLNMTKLRGR